MKKTTAILASAVALVMAGSAIAETTVYGRARMELAVASGDKDNNGVDDNIGLQNSSSRFGFKGSEDLGNGMSAIYKFELGYNADNKAQGGIANRIGMVGLKGDFGTFAMGNMWTPTYNLVDGNLDPFNGSNMGYPAIAFRAGDALAYANKFGDVKFQLAVVSNNSGTEDDLMDAYNVAVNFPAGPVSIGLGIHSNTDDSATVVSVNYKGDGFGLGFGYQDADKLANVKTMTLLGTMNVGTKGKLLLRWTDVDDTSTADKDYDGTTIGYHHALSKRTKVYVENSSKDLADETVIGLRHDF